VVLYSHGGRSSEVWWPQIENKLVKLDKLSVYRISTATLAELASLCQRGMQLTATVQDGQLWLADESRSVLVEVEPLKVPH